MSYEAVSDAVLRELARSLREDIRETREERSSLLQLQAKMEAALEDIRAEKKRRRDAKKSYRHRSTYGGHKYANKK